MAKLKKVGTSKDRPILVIDGNFLCHKAKHSMAKLSSKDIRTGVTFSFFKDLIRLMLKFQTNDIIFCWDSPFSLRKEEFSAYKEKRDKKKLEPQEKRENKHMHAQLEKLKTEILPRIGFKNQREQEGYEGDDMIATTVIDEPLSRFIVVANDGDLFQLLDLCNIYDFKKELDEETFIKTWGIYPEQWADVKVLSGCTTDEVPGIEGVGEKTACKFLLGTLGKNTKVYRRIIAEKKEIYKRNAPLVVLPKEGTKTFPYYRNELNITELMDVFAEKDFRSFLNKNNFKDWEYCFKGEF